MPRPRVLSFMSQWGGGSSRSPSTSTPASPTIPKDESPTTYINSSITNTAPESIVDSPSRDNPRPPRTESGDKRHSRRSSMIMAYQPPVMEIPRDTPAELQPVFAHLNSHTNKLYQEGYFLKLHDLDSRGRPSADRAWSECFAQLVGTVLSLWDAAQLDAAGDDGEVMPTFINLTDASIKMIESLPMNGLDGQSLQNVLSISTAANNRYLLHFNSLHSLTQWTAGIRLAMFEHSSLQEAYTGSIIAGKGKHLNNIRSIMERARYPTEDWARVRFGAGTPWRRCWCVISPPDEKEQTKVMKDAKKRSAYEKAPSVKGDIKFYETKKITKKTKPIATVKNAYAAYALYPQSRPLIDQSTLVKVEGTITIHSNPETTTEGFLFVMPEVHPAITGFEMLIRWLLPTFDTFALYGRPTKLIADVMDARSLMFAMPSGKRYGYLDLIDVAGLIHTEGSQNWSEREWRKQLKQLTAKRMSAPNPLNRAMSEDQFASKSSVNLPSSGSGIQFAGSPSRSQPGTRDGSPAGNGDLGRPNRNMSDPALPQQGYRRQQQQQQQHQRSASEAYRPQISSRLSSERSRNDPSPPRPPPHKAAPPMPHENGAPPPPPQHSAFRGPMYNNPQPYSNAAPNNYGPPPNNTPTYDNSQVYNNGPPPPQHGMPPVGQYQAYQPPPNQAYLGREEFPEVDGYQSDRSRNGTPPDQNPYPYETNGYFYGPPPMASDSREPVRPVAAPPVMAHKSNAHPPRRPADLPDIRRANSALDSATREQMTAANPAGGNRMQNGAYPSMPQDCSMYNQLNPTQATPGMRRNGPPPTPGYSNGLAAGGMTQTLPDRRLPTIPGTPAVEQENFDLEPAHVERSSKSISRKPIGNSS